VLALIALPILFLFGADMVTEKEIDASTRLITALTFAIAVCVAPILLWRRVRGRGVPPSDAMAAAIGLAVLGFVLTLALSVTTAWGNLPLVAMAAVVLVVLARGPMHERGTPPRPDIH
jgi:hypothetical protein